MATQIWYSQYLAAIKQLYEWFSPSVCLSAYHIFFTMFAPLYHHEISKVITNDRINVDAKGHGQRWNVKVTEVKTKRICFWTVTSLNSHMKMKWCTNFMWLRRGALFFQGHLSHSKVTRLTHWGFPKCNSSLGSQMSHRALWRIEEVPRCFPRSYINFQVHTGQKIADFDPNISGP